MQSLINIDQFEPVVVNRKLRQWPAAETCERLLRALQAKQTDFLVQPINPIWESGTWPLYFYHPHYYPGITVAEANKRVLERLTTDASVLDNSIVMKHVESLRSSQADILVSDDAGKWFFIVEAKIGRNPKFEYKPSTKALRKLGLTNPKDYQAHQLVHLDIVGKLLAQFTGKRFALATMGANQGEDNRICLSPTERALYKLIGEERQELHVVDLTWESLG